MNAFVTGASGFIGRRLVDRLVKDGHKVAALTRDPARRFPSGVKVVIGDLLEPDTYRESCAGVDTVFHLAALITFDPRRRKDLFEQNAQGTARILDTASGCGAECAVVTSSACTLGVSDRAEHLLDEDCVADDRTIAANPYLASKLAAEKEATRRAGDCRVVIVNPTTVFGPGDWSLNSGTLVAQVARSRVVPVPPGGSNVVDVDDVVEGIIAAPEKGVSGRRYVLGGHNLSFTEIVGTIIEVTGRTPLRPRLPMCFRGPARLAAWALSVGPGSRFITPQIVGDLFGYKYYSSKRARVELGWQPRFTFRESVDRAWEYYREEGLIE